MSTTSICKSIDFKSLICQLTSLEIELLISELPNDLIIKSLFYLIKSGESDVSFESIHYKIIKIIQSRKKNKNTNKNSEILTENNINSCKININTLPYHVIGFACSFLDNISYQHFKQVNRNVYLGCSKPNPLIKMNLSNIRVNLEMFPLIKHLITDLDVLTNHLSTINDKIVLNNLKYLKITIDLDEINNNIKSDLYSFAKKVNINNITHLYLRNFDDKEIKINKTILKKFLKKFKNLKYLSLENLCMRDSWDSLSIFEQLQGMQLIDCDSKAELILYRIGYKLQYLRISNFNYCTYKDVSFNDLQELIIDNLNNKNFLVVSSIVNSSKNLKKVKLNIQTRSCKNLIIKLLSSAINLEYLHITSTLYVDTLELQLNVILMNAIITGLCNSNHFVRNKLKINIGYFSKSCYEEEFAKEFLNNIVQIVNILLNSNTKHFMIIFDFSDIITKNKNTKKGITNFHVIDFIKNRISNILINRYVDCKFVISNMQCNIDGYLETWKM